jgi:hypothetical protein
VSDISTSNWQGPAVPSGTTEAPPMTRRERREREEREAAALSAQTASAPIIERPADLPPVTPVASAQPTAPMTRRERREMEERARLEQEADVATPDVSVPPPRPVVTTMDTGVIVVEDHADVSQPVVMSETEPVVELEGPPAPAALPPVFDLPVAPPRSGFPIATEDSDVDEAQLVPSREVGSGSPATHALILPTTPSIDIAGPIGDTGEILVTGQIPLPRLVAERGVQGDLDEDERFDELMGAETTSITSPVSAKSAVSSKGDDSEFHMVRKAPWGTAATVLGASAVLLVLAAAGLLAVALWTNLLAWPF